MRVRKNIFIPPGVFLRALQDPGNSLQLKTRNRGQNRKKPVILDKKLKEKSTKPIIKIVSMTSINKFFLHLSHFFEPYQIIKRKNTELPGKADNLTKTGIL